MKEIIDRIRILDQQAKCKDNVFRQTVMLYLSEQSNSSIKDQIFQYSRMYRTNDKSFRSAVRMLLEKL